MPTETIGVGPPTTLTQNVVYALPARAGRIHSLAAIEISVDGIDIWDALVGAETVGADVASGFVRCPLASTIAIFKPY
jgi:hypothetical protein